MARVAWCLLLLAVQAGAWRAAPALLRAEAVVSAAASAPVAGCAAAAEADAAAIAAKPRRSDTLLNVHLVAHTHDDVGWCAARAVAARCASSSHTLTQRRRVAPSRRSLAAQAQDRGPILPRCAPPPLMCLCARCAALR
jgi:hypothetical protein